MHGIGEGKKMDMRGTGIEAGMGIDNGIVIEAGAQKETQTDEVSCDIPTLFISPRRPATPSSQHCLVPTPARQASPLAPYAS